MGFDGDDDWALSDGGGNLILAGGDHVVDAFVDDLEALRSGRLGFKDTSMVQALPPLTSVGTTGRSQRFADWFLPFWEDHDPFGSDADDSESA